MVPDDNVSAEEPARPKHRRPSRLVFVALIVAFFAVASVALFLARNKTGTKGTAAPKVAKVQTVGVFDSFSRPNGIGLGTTDNGSQWQSITGVWGITSHEAYIVKPAARNLAIVDLGGREGTVQITMRHVENGCGLLFRYQARGNYVELLAAPKYATWVVDQITNFKVTALGNTGLSSTKDNVVLAVRLSGSTADVSIDGTLLKSFTVPDLPGATGVGLIGTGPDAANARWTDFVGSPLQPTTKGAPTTSPTTNAPTAPSSTRRP